MPGLILPQRWTRQPQYPVGLVDEFAKATLALNLIAGVEARCLATGRVLTKASPVAKINAIGKGVGCSDTTRAYLDTAWSPFTASNGDGTGDFSAILSFTATSSATRGTLLHSRCAISPFSSVLIRPNTSYVIGDTGGASSAASGNLFVGTFDSVSGVAGFNLAGVIDGSLKHLVFVREGGTLRVHLNGSTQSTTATAIDLITASGADLLFSLCGFASATGFPLEGTQNSCVVLPFAIPESDGAAISQNPWQIFRPQTRRIFFDVAGGAATHTTTGSLVAQSASVAGTAAHKTLHATSGALASQSAVIAGSATRVAGFVTHTTSGALSAASATVSGTAVHPHVTSGALAAQSAIIVGVAERSVAGVHATTGALVAGAATIAGTAVHVGIHATNGALAAQSAIIAGTSVHSGNISLTEADIAAIWAYEIEPGVSAKVAMQRLMSVLGGKVSGAGSGTETFRDINDTRDALVSVNDSNGNRTSLTWTDGA